MEIPANSPADFSPLRSLADIDELERVPLEQRLLSWDANDWIRRGLDIAPDKIAIQYVADGKPNTRPIELTYRELKQRAVATANLFRTFGVGDHDAVLYLMPTIPALYTVMLASLAVGVSCCVNWMLEPTHWIGLIKSSGAKLIVVLGPSPGYEIWEKFQTIRGELPDGVRVVTVQMPGDKLSELDVELLASRQPSDKLILSRRSKPDDIAAYMHSGGTTGSPKLVKLTHGGFCYKFWANTLVMAYAQSDVIFADYPMFHIAGFFGRGLMALANGMRIVIPSPIGARDKIFVENYWRFVETYRISVLSGVPTTLAQLAKNPPQGEDLSSLRPYGVTGSTAFPAEIARHLETLCGVRMMASYGATEYTQNVAQPPRDGDPRYGAAGLRLPYTQIKIVNIDDDGRIARECGVDEIGLVVVKGPSVTPGYVDREDNAGVLLPGGWFNSGDLGRIDGDGYLWITGRAKDIIIRGGHNIDPTVIEDVLLKHPDVVLAAAVGMPDSYAGELPVAYVQLVPEASTAADELAAFAAAHSSERAATPKQIILRDRMPLTDVGKPAKVKLRLDAAERAFTAAVTDVAGTDRISVKMDADGKRGSYATIQILLSPGADRQEIEDHVRERMKYYAVAFTIEMVDE